MGCINEEWSVDSVFFEGFSVFSVVIGKES